MLRERAAAELAYTHALEKWSERWTKQFDKKPEFGTLMENYQAMIRQTTQVATLHNTVHKYA
mgnify:CR=1 FL=1